MSLPQKLSRVEAVSLTWSDCLTDEVATEDFEEFSTLFLVLSWCRSALLLKAETTEVCVRESLLMVSSCSIISFDMADRALF